MSNWEKATRDIYWADVFTDKLIHVYIQYSNDMEGKQNPLLERIPVVSNNDNKELLNMNKYDLDLWTNMTLTY